MLTEIDPSSLLEEQLCFAIYSAMHAFNRAYRPLLAKLQLTYPQYLAMLVLWERDGQNVKTLADRLQLDSGTMTPLLKRLEQAGFIERHRDRTDERHVIVQLTDKGRDLERAAAGIPSEINRATGLSGAALLSLSESIRRVRETLDRRSDPDG